MAVLDCYSFDRDTVMVTLANGERDAVGTVTGVPEAYRARILRLLNRAALEQDRRHYTASARAYNEAESLGLIWTDENGDPE